MRAQVKVEFGRVSNADVDCGAGRDVAALADLLPLVGTEESSVMSLLDNDKRYSGSVVVFECHAGRANSKKFVSQDLMELAFGDAIAIKDYPIGLKSGRLVELDQQLLDHCGQIVYYFLSVLLNANRSRISTGMCVHRADDSSNGRLLIVTSRRMGHISSQEYHRLVEHLRPARGRLMSTFRANISISTYLMLGTRMLLIPPNLTLIFRHRFDSVCGDVLLTFLAWTHWVAIPRTVSPTRLTSA